MTIRLWRCFIVADELSVLVGIDTCWQKYCFFCVWRETEPISLYAEKICEISCIIYLQWSRVMCLRTVYELKDWKVGGKEGIGHWKIGSPLYFLQRSGSCSSQRKSQDWDFSHSESPEDMNQIARVF